ncbi:hypothetical protein BG169_003477 [Salmonella enterica subsp. enterica]|nr:hypothetical protein [Salmonella enterica subsp. enterica]
MNSKIKIAIAELKEIIFQKRHLCIQQCIHDENNKKGVINNDSLNVSSRKINTFKGHNETRHVGITENTVAGYNG